MAGAEIDVKRSSVYEMIAMDDAVSVVLRECEKVVAGGNQKDEMVGLNAALGRVLEQDAVAQVDLPAVPLSMKDGYAVRAADGPGEFPVVAQLNAGVDARTLETLPERSVAYIATGAPLPPGADAVVPVERSAAAESGGDRVVLTHEDGSVKAGQDVRKPGCDLKSGLVLPCGTLLREAEIGLLASIGLSTVRVKSVPTVGIISTGDEVIDVHARSAGEPAAGGAAFDSNRPMLLSAARAVGANVLDLGIIRDDIESVREALERAADSCDVVVTSGGVSMGKKDVLQRVLSDLGTVHFGRVCMKPGKPLTFSTLTRRDGKHTALVLSLPGNAVSSFVCFHLVVAPVIRSLAGLSPLVPVVNAVLDQPLVLDKERPEYHRARLSWDLNSQRFVAVSTGAQASSRLLSACGVNALLKLPAADQTLQKGDIVEAMLLYSQL